MCMRIYIHCSYVADCLYKICILEQLALLSEDTCTHGATKNQKKEESKVRLIIKYQTQICSYCSTAIVINCYDHKQTVICSYM